jgi:hypothetical protein
LPFKCDLQRYTTDGDPFILEKVGGAGAAIFDFGAEVRGCTAVCTAVCAAVEFAVDPSRLKAPPGGRTRPLNPEM